MLLDCAAWGVTDPSTLRFLDSPPAPALAEARKLLQDLSALGPDGRITDVGRRLRALALPPRLARMVLGAAALDAAGMAAELAAVLVERGLGGDQVDLDERIERFRTDRSMRAEDMRRLARGWAAEAGGGKGGSPGAGVLLALAYPDRLARARGRPGAFLLANGRGAELEPYHRLSREPWLVVAELAGSAASSRILAAAALSAGDIEAVAGGALASFDETVFDQTARALRRRAGRRIGAIVLQERTMPVEPGPDSALCLARGAAVIGIDRLPWSRAQRALRSRVAFLRAAGDETWPDLSDDGLAPTVSDWLAPHLHERASLDAVTADDLAAALGTLLPWELARRLEQEAPSHFEAPTGSRVAVDYEAEAGPTVSIRVQELFGLAQHPALAAGRVPLVLELLSPAHRPIQVTRDLPGFWRGSWAAVRTEMRGRYPRHVWPENPAAATPTTRAKPRGT
jgi:ATP-dependent helicase HrpB